jgi:glycosyltransferase involved in cell wall biosynthesis
MFNENNIGVAVDIGDYDTLAEKIKELYHSPELREELAQNAKAFAQQHFSSTQNTKKFIDIFYKIAEGKE